MNLMPLLYHKLAELRLATQRPAARTDRARAALDFAFVPEARKLADMRLLAIDMDSPLITIECIDEVADLAGVKAEVSTITAAAMSGELDYARSLQRRVALLQNGLRLRRAHAWEKTRHVHDRTLVQGRHELAPEPRPGQHGYNKHCHGAGDHAPPVS